MAWHYQSNSGFVGGHRSSDLGRWTLIALFSSDLGNGKLLSSLSPSSTWQSWSLGTWFQTDLFFRSVLYGRENFSFSSHSFQSFITQFVILLLLFLHQTNSLMHLQSTVIIADILAHQFRSNTLTLFQLYSGNFSYWTWPDRISTLVDFLAERLFFFFFLFFRINWKPNNFSPALMQLSRSFVKPNPVNPCKFASLNSSVYLML